MQIYKGNNCDQEYAEWLKWYVHMFFSVSASQ